MTTTKIEGIEGLRELVGKHLGYTSWHRITQGQIDAFAEATGDHQWIHVDVEKAKQGPFGQTIAHGYLTLSLLPVLLPELISVAGVSMGVNYGTNRVRFPSPVPSGSNIRLGATVASVTEINGGAQAAIDVTVEVEGAPKPSMVAQVLYNYYL
ncbi:Acyl dehydratase [Ferrithrix thermotolerans DSM 19514]|uniref:Acyl dehydratase n=1 Tax=Ferrithrix thermotolerans DSM 19514 TaxID=1121881 RepID=A0A1M4SFB9_9ACTN|nr:MaoC family dehydratase [Ferrithrix thermotolerans]SHE30896.1 Acyl dehydratase [Ferrithrix thermotolerans DSM 19514]